MNTSVANRELFTYNKGNMGVTVKQLFPRVNSYNITVVFKYTQSERKYVKKTCLYGSKPIYG